MRIAKRISIPLLCVLLVFLTGCNTALDSGIVTDSAPLMSTEEEAETEPISDPIETLANGEPKPIPNQVENNTMQLIPDITFATGFKLLSQKDHANGDAIQTLATRSLYTGREVSTPRWSLAQWDSGPCLVENMIPSPPNVITDGMGRTFSYDPQTACMTFELDSSLYYQGKPAIQGDYWPHLLITQGDFDYAGKTPEEQAYYRCDAKSLIVSFDIRLTDYSITPHPDDWVDAAQFLMYFYVKGTNSHDFCWFGLQLFDNRWARNEHFIGYDGGKPDASGAMIFSIGSRYVYRKAKQTLWQDGAPNPNGDFIHVEIDLKPYLEDMFERGKEDGYFKVQSLSELCINGMNLGWETIGTFDHTMEIKNLKLISTLGED